MRFSKILQTFIIFVSLSGLFWDGSCHSPNSSTSEQGPVVIAAIGDSLTWGALAFGSKADSGGYPAILESMLRHAGYNVVVFNKGIPGEKTYQTRQRFQKAIADADIALLTIGVNDIIRPESCPQPTNCQTIEHIAAMIKIVSKAKIPLLISTLTPAQSRCSHSWVNTPIQEINRQIAAIARKHQIPLVDNHQAVLEHGGGTLFSDCLHFKDEGYRVIADQWQRALIEQWLVKKSAS